MLFNLLSCFYAPFRARNQVDNFRSSTTGEAADANSDFLYNTATKPSITAADFTVVA
jgi:hypothetical protein